MSRRSYRAPRRRTGFTLLEAMIAVVILAGVAAVCLQLRVQSLRTAFAVEEAGAERRAIEHLLMLAEAGVLPGPQGPADDDPTMTVRWRGDWLGRPFLCTKARTPLRSPIPDAAQRGLAETIVLDQYTLEYNGETVTTYRVPAPIREATTQ